MMKAGGESRRISEDDVWCEAGWQRLRGEKPCSEHSAISLSARNGCSDTWYTALDDA